MNCSMPGLPVHHQLPGFNQSHVHRVGDAIQPSVVPFSYCPQSLPASGSLTMSQLFAWSGQSIGVSASTSVPPMNTQDWSSLGWTGWTTQYTYRQTKDLVRPYFLMNRNHKFYSAIPPCSWNFYRCQWKMSIYTRLCLNIGFAVVVQLPSCVWLFVTPQTAAPCLQDFPGKNTGVGCHFSSRGSIKYYFYIEIIYNLKHLTVFLMESRLLREYICYCLCYQIFITF